jgi:hypothetical protein
VRTLVLCGLLLLGLALVPGVATAKQQSVNRAYSNPTAGTAATTDTFDVTGDAVTFEATGFWERVFTATGQRMRAEVDCLRVVGNTAHMTGVYTVAEAFPQLLGDGFYHSMQDNGAAGQGDLVHSPIVWFFPAGPPPCSPPFTNLPPTTPITSGDVVVEPCEKFKDKPDTDKDKCKDKP